MVGVGDQDTPGVGVGGWWVFSVSLAVSRCLCVALEEVMTYQSHTGADGRLMVSKRLFVAADDVQVTHRRVALNRVMASLRNTGGNGPLVRSGLMYRSHMQQWDTGGVPTSACGTEMGYDVSFTYGIAGDDQIEAFDDTPETPRWQRGVVGDVPKSACGTDEGDDVPETQGGSGSPGVSLRLRLALW